MSSKHISSFDALSFVKKVPRDIFSFFALGAAFRVSTHFYHKFGFVRKLDSPMIAAAQQRATDCVRAAEDDKTSQTVPTRTAVESRVRRVLLREMDFFDERL